MTKLQYPIEIGKGNAEKMKNNSLIINELKPSVFEGIYSDGRLDCPISIVKGITPKIIEKTTLRALIAKLTTGEATNIETALRLKTAYKDGDKKMYDAIKHTLNGFVIGSFKSRKDADLVIYVPLLCLDIDGYSDSLEASWDLDLLRKHDKVFAAWFSPSGCGLRVLVWTDATPETHKATYTALQAEFCTFLNLTTNKEKFPHMDVSTSNVSRLWFFTETDDVYLNVNSDQFHTPSIVELKNEPMATPKTMNKKPHTHEPLTDAQKLEICIEIAKKDRKISDGDTNPFVFCVACIAIEQGVSADTILAYFSNYYAFRNFDKKAFYDKIEKPINSANKRTHQKFEDGQLMKYLKNGNPSVNSAVVPSLNNSAITPNPIKSKSKKNIPSVLVSIHDSNDDSADDEDVSKFAKVEAFLTKNYDIRFNTVSRELEIKRKNEDDFTHLDDFEFNDLLRAISKKNIKVSDKSLAISLFSSFTPRYNPFKSYMDSLPKWNETDKDHIAHLASFVKAKDPVWFMVQFKKALVRTVACAIGQLPFNKHCLVFHGKQNDGKSTFIRFLVAKVLEGYLKENLKVDKDGLISLCQNFIINLDEIDTMNKGDLDQIKALFATDSVKERLPYARTPAKFKRTASFFGSTNKNEFLTDETGNVRWVIIEIDEIDFSYGECVDIDAVWSQAYSLLKNGFVYEITKDEMQKSEQNNQRFKRVYIELELLQQRFEPCDKDHQDAVFMLSSTMLNRIANETTLKLNVQLFAKALAELGFKKMSKRQDRANGTTVPMNGFYVIEKI